MRYMLIAPDKTGHTTTIMELTKDAFVVPVDTPQAHDAMEAGETSFFMNAPDNVLCAVIPVVEMIEFTETLEIADTPVVEITVDMLDEFIERFERMGDPDDTLIETEFLVNGVKVKLVN